MAWFTQPATRAMMMHTTVFGKYDGPEEVSLANELYTVINLLEIYAPTRRIEITVRDGSGRAVPDAEVKYKVYNYAEFYPIATHTTDQQGKSTLTTGFGDLVVWASQGDSYGYSVIAANTDTADVTIEPGSPVLSRDFTLGVPPERQGRQVHSDKVAENRRRLAVEDSIRNAYMSGFMPGGELIGELARKTGMEYDRVYHFLNEAQGNAGEIVNFLSARQRSPWLEEFLGSLTSKDLRDTPERYLSAFLPPGTTPPYGVPDELVPSKILSPRIEMEIIRPWREPLTEFLASRPDLSDPYSIVEFVRDNIRVDDSQNYVACRITPGGVHATRLADRRSRDIYFVALCRAARIAAHIDRATGKPQFYMDGDWHDALLDDSGHAASVPPMGTIVFDSHEDNRIVPAYRSHFTVARYSDGDFSTLDLSGRLREKEYPTRAEVPAGYYRLTAGSRANDGSVAVHNRYFEVAEGDIVELLIALPDTRQKLFVEGILDMNTIVFLADGTKTTLKDQALGHGLILVFADPANEPTRHVLQEMPAFRERLEQWGGGIVFAVPDDLAGATINEGIFPGLPSQAIWLPDGGNALLNTAVESLRLDFQSDFPLCLYLNNSGGILFSGSGYSPGTVERIYRTIAAERQPGQAL
ncbi:MAG: transglutaminase domain-containing protein [Alistipes sp.]|nr:transglutaminase domain-containing protein [Alistipes sp.]